MRFYSQSIFQEQQNETNGKTWLDIGSHFIVREFSFGTVQAVHNVDRNEGKKLYTAPFHDVVRSGHRGDVQH